MQSCIQRTIGLRQDVRVTGVEGLALLAGLHVLEGTDDARLHVMLLGMQCDGAFCMERDGRGMRRSKRDAMEARNGASRDMQAALHLSTQLELCWLATVHASERDADGEEEAWREGWRGRRSERSSEDRYAGNGLRRVGARSAQLGGEGRNWG